MTSCMSVFFRSSSRFLYERRNVQTEDLVFQYKGERYSKNQYFFGEQVRQNAETDYFDFDRV